MILYKVSANVPSRKHGQITKFQGKDVRINSLIQLCMQLKIVDITLLFRDTFVKSVVY